MTTGSEISRSLQSAANTLRAKAITATAEADGARGRADMLIGKRWAAIDELARHYLPSFEDTSGLDAFTRVQRDLEAVEAKREQRIGELRERVTAAHATRAEQDSALEALTDELSAKVEERDKLEEQVAETLEVNPEFRELSIEASKAELELERDESRAEELAAESVGKRPAYESSRLFMYLWERRYATAQYKGSGLVRRLDEWVSDLIGYRKARLGYEFVCVTPELVAQEVARRGDEFAALMEKLEQMESDAADAAGLTAVQAEGERLGAKRDELVEAILEGEKALETTQTELTSIEQSRGIFYAEAIDTLKAFLERTETEVLRRRARETPSRRDDEIVSDLARASGELDELRPNIAELQSSAEESERRARGFETLLARYRQAEFDSPRSKFDGFDMRAIQHAAEHGTSTEKLWSELKSRQRFRSTSLARRTNRRSGGAGEFLREAASSPLTRVLIHAMGNAVGGAMRGAAQRGARRWGGSSSRRSSSGGLGGGIFGGGGSSRRSSGGSRRSVGGGFTRGRGF